MPKRKKKKKADSYVMPQNGVSLALLKAILDDPRMQYSIAEIIRPENPIETLSEDDLRAIAKEGRAFSSMPNEFEMYLDKDLPRQILIDAVRTPCSMHLRISDANHRSPRHQPQPLRCTLVS